MRHALVSLFALVAIGCGSGQRPPAPPTVLTIPRGPGEWVIVEREIALESLTTGRLVLPYGAGSTGRALKHQAGQERDSRGAIRYQIVFAADPLAAGDRCVLRMSSFQVVHADGSITETPAHGHVIDNSDRKDGFRAELSANDRKQLVIPSGATATAMFEQPVTVSTRQ